MTSITAKEYVKMNSCPIWNVVGVTQYVFNYVDKISRKPVGHGYEFIGH